MSTPVQEFLRRCLWCGRHFDFKDWKRHFQHEKICERRPQPTEGK